MRAVVVPGRVLLLVALVLASCGTLPMPDAGANPCNVDFPGLRVDTTCSGEIDVFIDGREVPPTPRRQDLPGAVILPWPDFAADGVPAYATNGSARVDFQVQISVCQVVSLSCP